MVIPKIEPTDLNALAIDEDFGAPFTLAGWVSPAGDYFRVKGDWGHDSLAASIVGEPGDYWGRLVQDGWVHLSERGKLDISSRKQMTRAQINTLFDIATLVPGTAFAEEIILMLRDVE